MDKTLQESVSRFRKVLLADEALYDAFVASIQSALIEAPAEIGVVGLAKFIADRIIGKEEKGKGEKQLDVGKIKALWKANWSVPKIADEMGVCDGVIADILGV